MVEGGNEGGKEVGKEEGKEGRREGGGSSCVHSFMFFYPGRLRALESTMERVSEGERDGMRQS